MEPGSSVPLAPTAVKNTRLALMVVLVMNMEIIQKHIQINDQNIKHTPIACKNEGAFV